MNSTNTSTGLSPDNQFLITIITLVINTAISLFAPLISAIILVMKRIEKSKCCGGEINMRRSEPPTPVSAPELDR